MNPSCDAPLSRVVDTLLLPTDAACVAQHKIVLGRASWQMVADDLSAGADGSSKIDGGVGRPPDKRLATG